MRPCLRVLVLLPSLGLAFVPAAGAGQVPTVQVAEAAAAPGAPSAAESDAEAGRPEVGRTFAEPLMPVGRPRAGETAQLAQAIARYRAAADVEAVQPILDFLDAHPASAWKPSLLANLAVLYRHTGYLDRALAAAREAWRLTSASTDLETKRIADGALATYVEILASLGRTEELAALLTEVRSRPLGGHAAETLSGARSSLWQMRHDPAGSFRCGPLAVERVSAVLRPGAPPDPRVLSYPSTSWGTSLAELARLARDAGLDLRAIRREPGSTIPVPAVVHWKAGHFAALVEQSGNRFLVKDLTFGDDRWLSRRAVEEESSGYLLAAGGAEPRSGWRSVSDREAAGVRGRGASANPNPGATASSDPMKPDLPGDCGGGGGGGSGMPHYDFHVAVVSLHVTDSPVGYTPPRGPAMRFGITYNSREDFQPATFTFTNLGSRWSFDWLSYVEDDDPQNAGQTVRVAERGGGSYVVPHIAGSAYATYGPIVRGQHDTVVRTLQGTATVGFVRQFPDGSQEVYGQSDGAATMRKYFLTSVIDPAGNTVTLGYDAATTRLLTISDPLGQTATLGYGLAGDIYKVTAVTDPFGRQATFQYAGGEVQSVTDAVGMTSSFAYGPTANDTGLAIDFLNAMTTPYGTTSFDMGEAPPANPNDIGDVRWLVATDPLGNQERIEFLHEAPGIPPSTSMPVPSGFSNQYLQMRNTFYWNASAMQQYSASDPNRYLNATYLFHWLHDGTGSVVAASSIPESVQAQGQNRIWYGYPGEPAPMYQGSLSTPTTVAQVLDTGQQQVYALTYDASGRPQSYVDPAGRTYSFGYAANGIDLTSVSNALLNGGAGEPMVNLAYNSMHLPTTITDYAGQSSTAAYNSFGELASLTRPDDVSTVFTYDPRGFLTQVTRPGTQYQEGYTYDGANRLQSWTSTDGYTLTFAYDNLDRLTGITFPDGTSESVVFNRLDVIQYQDRMGRITSFNYDPADRLVSSIDSAGRTTTYSWCGCGALAQVNDPLGHETAWLRDGLDRVVAKEVNGQVAALYDYDGSGRLVHRTDALNQVTAYSYTVDDMLAAVSYQNAVHPTPGVQFQYDLYYPRRTGMTDGFGTTTYSYYPAGVLGAGQVASIVAPAPNHTITYQYDAVGRRTGMALNGVAQTVTFDSEDRPSAFSNPLGTFSVAYNGASSRVAWVVYPNKQSVTLYYADNLHDERISEMRWGPLNSFNLSQFNYTYDAAHDQIAGLTWYDVNHPSGAFFDFAYDGAKQLLTRQQTSNPSQSPVTVLHTYSYGYDAAGNRTSETIDGTAATATYDGANQLIAIERGLSEQAQAAIQGARARSAAGPPRGSGRAKAGQAPPGAPRAPKALGAPGGPGAPGKGEAVRDER